ncbi:MAG: LysR family transcriptional regulator [Burkholderiaceae bacterium]
MQQHQQLHHLRLDDLVLFSRVAELGTLSAAARERDIPVSQVTRTLNRIETDCGARLLHRTTHGLSLTDEGDTFLAYCRQMQDQMVELSSELSGKISGPSGWVRVTASALIAQAVIGPSLMGLYARHPDVRIDINADDRMADMARDGIDIAIRSGVLSSDTMVAKQIGSVQRSLYAAPTYLAKAGTPQQVDELINHHLIGNSAIPAGSRWPVKLDSNRGQTITDNSALVLSLTLGGLGIAQLIDLTARPLVATGQLVPVLAGHFEKPSIPIYAVMLQERHRLPKIRACIDYWAEWIGQMQ